METHRVGRFGGIGHRRRSADVGVCTTAERLGALVVVMCLLCQAQVLVGACPDTCTCNGGAVLSCTFPPGAVTTELSWANKGITSIASGLFDGLTGLKKIDLHSNQIATLPSGIFDKHTTLTDLYLYSNQIATFPTGIFDKLTALTTLYLQSNQIATLPSGIFDKLTALTGLDLSANQITTLPYAIFDKLTLLSTLYLFSNRITTLPSAIFDKLTTLSTFYLYSNQIATLPVGIFDKLTALYSLDIHSNKIAALPVGIFDKLTVLSQLQLNSNPIASLPIGIFDKLNALTNLNLMATQIATLPSGIFDKLTALTTLSLSTNQIVTLPSGIFDKLTALTYLSLSTNQIVTLPGGIFNNLTALSYFDLSSNQIAILPSGIFGQLTALTQLYLQSNQIAALPSEIFDKLSGLRTLQLNFNRIATLPSGIFDKFITLTTLQLNSNQIATLPSGIFDKLIALNTLYLHGNGIATLPSGIFSNLAALRVLQLNSNLIATLPSGIFDKLTALTALYLYSNQLATLPIGIFDKLTTLNTLQLNSNQIATLPSGIFDKLSKVSGVLLDSNPGNRGNLCSNNTSRCVAKTCANCFCDIGWTGTACSATCTSGTFGSDCAMSCGCKNGAACDPATGACTCSTGWTGSVCDIPCTSDRFGANCSSVCGCKNGAACDRFNGCACSAGWTGVNCDQVCAGNRFGANCGNTCNCNNGAACDRFTGACTCPAGWMGVTCNVECPVGQYGPNCTLACPCSNGICNRFNGTCECAAKTGLYGPSCSSCACNGGVCNDGFFGNGTCNCTALLGVGGTHCNTTCDLLPGRQMYGYGCNTPCNCENGAACDASTGKCTCTFGWTGVICNVVVAPSVPKVNATTEWTQDGIGIRLRWSHDDVGPRAWNAWHYEIRRAGCIPKVYQVGDVLTFIDTNVVIGQGYAYFVQPFNSMNVSSPTAGQFSIERLEKAELPSPPYTVSSTPTLDPDNNQHPMIKFTWKEDTSSGPIIETLIFRDGRLIVKGRMATEYKDRDVVFGRTYKYEIVSVNQYGNSNATRFSETASIGPADSGTPTAGGASSSSNVAGPVAGGVVGAIVGAAGIVFAILFVRKRASRKKMEALARTELDLIDTVVRRPEIAEIEIPGSCIHLRNRIGEGEFGEVYLADITPRGGSFVATKAAVKTFKVTALSSADEIRSARSAFMAEIDLMRTIPKHTNIIELVGVCTQSEPNCMVLEFAAHGDLRHFLSNGKASDFTSTDLLCFCIDIARGMEHLAKCEIVHRDLAARNCMVVAGPRPPNSIENGWKLSPKAQVIVKVADMGLSRDTGGSGDYYMAKTRRKLPVKWMSPESLQHRIFTHASDVWSFGVVMWEVFARGAKPYPGVENHDVLTYLSQNKRMDPPMDCPKQVNAAMESCWRKHAETRPQFSQIVVQLRRGMAVLCGAEGGGGRPSGRGSDGDIERDSTVFGQSGTYAVTVPEDTYAETPGEGGTLYTLDNAMFQQDSNSKPGHFST